MHDLEGVEMSDYAGFKVTFKKYLARRGRPESVIDQWFDAIDAFSLFHAGKDKEKAKFWLTRVVSLHRASREDLVPLPPPWKWLDPNDGASEESEACVR